MGFVLLLISLRLSAQIKISGAECIIPGITYQYNIKGPGSDSAGVKVNITGGEIVNGIAASTDRVKLSAVYVVWKDTAYKTIEVQAKKFTATLSVQATQELSGGKLDTEHNIKTYDSTTKTYTFLCSEATGGACSPKYSYRWQQSNDGLVWTDIKNANGKDLRYKDEPLADMYFRRVCEETISNTIAYSDIAVLMVRHY
jgi:hypothetical protein